MILLSEDPSTAGLSSQASSAALQCWWGHQAWGLGPDSLPCPTELVSSVPTASQVAVFDPT